MTEHAMASSVLRTSGRPPRWAVAVGVTLSAVTLGLGYAAFGLVTMLVLGFGFGGGLLLPSRGSWTDIKVPYWTALVLFVIHRLDEKQAGFFAYLSEVTGVPTPSIGSAPVILLLITSEFAHLSLFPLLSSEGPQYVPAMWTVIALAPVAWWGMWRLAFGARSPSPAGG